MKKLGGGFLGFLIIKAQENSRFFRGNDSQMFRDKNGVPFRDKLILNNKIK